jgi:threonine/homoserine/homoserine lactone efflux protein
MAALIEAFLLGLVGGAIPGPILTGTFTEILNTNFRRGLRIIFWALIAETVGALLVLFVFYKLGLSETVVKIISIGGGLVLFWLASKVWKISGINTENKSFLSFWQIIILTALNSGYWIFWITVGIPKALILDQTMIAGKFIFLIIFEIAWLIITIALAFIFYKFRPLLQKNNLVGATFKVLALVLVILGIRTIISVFI